MTAIVSEAPVRAKSGPKASASASEPSPAPATPADPAPTGLNAAQLEIAMEVIAGRLVTLHQLVILSNDPGQSEFVRAVCGDAAEALTTAIGAMADHSICGEVLGDANRWHFGYGFDDAGKAGAA